MAFAGLATILLVLFAILSKRFSALVALIVIPVLIALLMGFGLEINTFIGQGISKVAPVAVMFIFAILFFGILHEAKMFDPIVAGIINVVGHDPRKIFPGTVLLTALVHLDGSGASTFLIAIPALKPLYEKLALDLRILACLVAMTAGVCNMLPWGGPAIRAASALELSVLDVYLPMLWVQLSGLVMIVAYAFILGQRVTSSVNVCHEKIVVPIDSPLRLGINILTTLAVLSLMVSGVLKPMIAFMLGTVIALLVNFPKLEQQTDVLNKHAKTALLMAGILFAAGVFNGILKGTGMLEAMASQGAHAIPSGLTDSLAIIIGLVAMPMSLLFDPDSFYFGIVPVLASVAEHSGIAGVEIAQAALLGQMTTGFAVSPLTPSTFLLVGLCGLDLADHQRYTIPKLLLLSWGMVFVSILTGVISL